MKCPKCKTEIDHLRMFEQGEQETLMFANGSRYVKGFYLREEPDSTDVECPECNEVLFHDEEKAEEFLNAGKEKG